MTTVPKPGVKLWLQLPAAVAVFLATAAVPVSASVLEKFVMPGPVAAVHADIEGECSLCHTKNSGIPEQQLCVDCHERVGDDIANGTGFHGRDQRASVENCSSCHTDHEGRDADIIIFSERTFDHDISDFPLIGAHVSRSCNVCHDDGIAYADAPNECVGCHRDDDSHRGQLGESCGDCHSQSAWTGAQFQHDLTGFMLTGAHTRVACESCHRGALLSDVSAECVDCHRAEDVHDGGNGEQCQECHSTSDWTTVRFDHGALTGFALTGGHAELNCNACHASEDFAAQRGADCHACHAKDDTHEGRFGRDCGSCHAPTEWTTIRFEHSAVSDFLLLGAHQSLQCTACHAGNLNDPLESECGACHKDDDPHNGQLGKQCGSCHTEYSWAEEIRFDHGLTRFPLIGKHEAVVCAGCHESQAFHDTPEECSACHLADDAHDGALGLACESCHSPASWQRADFDHAAETRFQLTGAHDDLRCEACHAVSTQGPRDIPLVCGQCHERDDRHDGRFGPDCGTCHSTKTFTRVSGL